jgi:hypothetical protein
MKINLKFCFLLASTIVLLGSCNTDYYSKNDFLAVKKIDAHIHYLTEKNAFSELAVTDNFSLIDINYDDNGSDSSLNSMEKMSLNQKNRFSGQFYYLTSFNLKDWDSANWADLTIKKLETSFKNGAVGVKIWKNIGMKYKDAAGNFIMIDNPRFEPVIQYIIDQDKTILGHLGEPKNCWLPLDKMTTSGDKEYFSGNPGYHMYLHPEFPSYQAQMDARDRLVEKHPDLRFVGAHLGSMEWSVDEIAKHLDKYPNMAVDLSARLAHLQLQSQTDYSRVRNFMIKYQDQLIYGSDEWLDNEKDPQEFKKVMHGIWLWQWEYLATDDQMTNPQINGGFKGLKLPKTVIDKIYRLNAIKWYKLTTW